MLTFCIFASINKLRLSINQAINIPVDEDYDGCYVKTDEDNLIHCYQEGEDEGEWNYVKMNEDFDVLLDVTFNPDADKIYSLIP